MNIQQRQQHSSDGPHQPRYFHIAFKGAIATSLLAGFILYRVLLPQPNVTCIYDAYQSATLAANRQLVMDPNSPAFEGNSNQLTVSGQAFIGVGQVIMDLWIAIFGIIWLVKVKNVRGFGAIAAFFLTRGVIFLNIQKFPYPDNIVWRSPGFFSFTVPYDHTRDFFYSGHTGSLATIFLQMVILQLWGPAVAAFLCLIFMMNMLLITQVHYVVDIIGALVIAAWYHRSATRAVLWIDKALSLPFFVCKWTYENKCKPYCQEEESDGTAEERNEGGKAAIQSEKDFQGDKVGDHKYDSIQIESRRSRKSNQH